MSTKRTNRLKDWPPSINWDLLKSGPQNPSVPRRFLKEESWKLLLASDAITEEEDASRFVITIPIHIPETMAGPSDHWLRLMLRSAIRLRLKEHALAFDPSSTTIKFNTVTGEKLSHERQHALLERFRDRTLLDWLRLYVKGLYFASQIGRADQDRYVFIEEVYFPTKYFDQAKAAYLFDYQEPILIKGVPRAGKTYTALRLLYDALDDAEASIKLVSNWSDPEDILDIARDLEDCGKLFVLFDDPFGIDEYNYDLAAPVIENLAERYKQHRLLITTRDEVYRAASHQVTSLRLFPHTEIALAPETTDENALLYSEILERTAWLHGANWLSQYRQHLKKEITSSIVEPKELREAWQTVVRQSYVPGVLLSAFILYPQIAYLNMEDPAAVRGLAIALGRAVDVRSAFRSELDTFLRSAESYSFKVLYLLLPALTLVQESTLDSVFTSEEKTQLHNELGQYFEATVGDDFAVESYRYKLDIFAEVAQEIIEEEGFVFLGKNILPELARRDSFPGRKLLAELVVDVLTRYFWLGGRIGNQSVVSLMESLKQYSIGTPLAEIALQRDQIYVLGTLFQKEEPRLGYDLLVKRLAEADPELISNVASILDQLLTTQIREPAKLVQRVARVVGLLHEEFFAPSDAEGSVLRASLLLHGVLSHLEKYFMVIDEESLTALEDKDSFDIALWDLLGVKPLLSRIQRNEGDWVRPALMWLDAIIMKMGELNFYLVEHEVTSGEEDTISYGIEVPYSSLPEEVIQQNLACGTLYSYLVTGLEHVTSAICQVASSEERAFLEGGLVFTLGWHNRWCSAKPAANGIAKWADTSGLLIGLSDQHTYWQGTWFNMLYHAKYFEVKASAWQRESAIYRLRREKGPRLGADTLHESGLPADKQLEDWKPRFKSFYRNCLDHLLPYSSEHALSPPPEIIEQASFLLGMRAPREPSLQEEYTARICFAVEGETCFWRHHLWRGITKLFAFNLREPMKVVEWAIGSDRFAPEQRALLSLLDVIDEIENRLKNDRVRYVPANLEKLKKQLASRQ
jgi:hypothetical protein